MKALQVYRDANGQMAISRDDHRRYCDGLLAISRAFGGMLQTKMRHALNDGAPSDRHGDEARRYFGAELPIIVKMLQPVIEAIESKLPDFKVWFVLTGFGNDKDFMLALMAMDRALANYKPPRGRERRRALAGVAPKVPDHLPHAKGMFA